jgi:hypothetical protein
VAVEVTADSNCRDVKSESRTTVARLFVSSSGILAIDCQREDCDLLMPTSFKVGGEKPDTASGFSGRPRVCLSGVPGEFTDED